MGRRRTLYASWRFTRFLAREFRWPLAVFLAIVFGGGLLIHLTYTRARPDYVESCYAVFLLVFIQPELPFPEQGFLRVLFFVIPIIGLGAVADSLVRLGYFIFSRKQNLQEWQIMEASAMRDHHVVVGVGKVGYRILKELAALKLEAVGIERKSESHLIAEILDLGIPVIRGDARLKKTLEDANVAQARAIHLATDDDLANLDAALTARELRADIRVVLRFFDDTLADRVATAFKMKAISTSRAAVPAFIAAATGRSVLQAFCLEGQDFHLADLAVAGGSKLAGRKIGDLRTEFGWNVVMHRRSGRSDMNPDSGTVLQPDDNVVVVAPVGKLGDFES